MKKILLILLPILLVSCKTTERITYIHDTIDNSCIATVYKYDSVYVDKWHTMYVKGDTVWRTDSIVRYKMQLVHDTLIDSMYITKEIPVEKIVIEKQKGFFWWLGWISLFLILGVALGFLLRYIVKKH